MDAAFPSWPGLTRPSTQCRRYLRTISNLCNIINYLIVGLDVLVDGRVKPGHDEKTEVGRYGAISNG
jgi:hypothetical protein